MVRVVDYIHVLSELHKHDCIDKIAYYKEFRNQVKANNLHSLEGRIRSNTKEQLKNLYRREILRGLFLNDFGAASAIIDTSTGGDAYFFKDPIFREHEQKIDKENKEITKCDLKILYAEKRISDIEQELTHSKKTRKLKKERDELRKQIDEQKIIRKEWQKKRAMYTMLMIPRGLAKTTLFQAHRGVWYTAKYAVEKNQVPSICFLHGSETKAKETLSLYKEIVFRNEMIADLFSDVFERETNTQNEVRFKFHSKIPKKGADAFVWSIESEPAGIHPTIILRDDTCLPENTSSPVKNEANKKKLYNLRYLNDHSDSFVIEGVGTAYYDDSFDYWLVNAEKKDGTPYCRTTIRGVYSIDEKGERVYNFEWASEYTRENIEEMEYQAVNGGDNFGFKTQLLMQFMPRQKVLELVNNKDFVFAYKDEKDVPDGVVRLPYTYDDLIDNGCVITSKDPSYSKLHKSWDSDCSKDTTITGAVFNGKLFLIDEDQMLGGDSDELYKPLYRQVYDHYSDVVVLDAQGTQMIFADVVNKRLREDIEHRFLFKYYKKPKQTTQGKAERAALIVGELFKMKTVFIHWKCKRLIAEIVRDTAGFDFLDCIIQICSWDFNILEGLGRNRRNMNDRSSNVYSIYSQQEEWVDSVTGY